MPAEIFAVVFGNEVYRGVVAGEGNGDLKKKQNETQVVRE